jgi:uncharacterized protein YeaO (DUF488 family)
MTREVCIFRIYGNSGREGDQYRVLVDRLWPRGQSKNEVDLDDWAKNVAPSTELRRWYRHDPERFADFSRRYRAELTLPPATEVLSNLCEISKARTLVLLTATRDVEYSGATVLRNVIVSANDS